MLRISVDEFNEVTEDPFGVVHVKRTCILGGRSTRAIVSCYDAFSIARWLYKYMRGYYIPVQDAFPDMDIEDRGFLMSGITPRQWSEMEEKDG